MRQGLFVTGALIMAAAWATRDAATAHESQAMLPAEEVRAVTFLTREVPRWKRDNDCYSCHNNGDAARALIVAARRGHAIGDALDDTLDWLRQPLRWEKNKTEGGIDDKPLARVQFAGALRLMVDSGRAAQGALDTAATLVARDQHADGSWRLDASESIGSPTTYGTALATWAATRAMRASRQTALAPALARADRWLRQTSVERVVDAAAVLLALQQADDPDAHAQRARALTTIAKGHARDGGWGPYVTVASEVFDTALVVLALADLRAHAALTAAVYPTGAVDDAIRRGRSYLLEAQSPDGSWPETTRPPGQESYAQRISTTGWALLALLESR